MKKTGKKLIQSLEIWVVTLAAGFLITYVSFNLFDNLTANQLKLLFAADIIMLSAIGAAAWFFSESKKAKKRKEAAFEKRHNERIVRQCKELGEINSIISRSNFAA